MSQAAGAQPHRLVPEPLNEPVLAYAPGSAGAGRR